MQRRDFLKTIPLVLALPGGRMRPLDVPVRALTQGPGFHWFGYYDKLQFDPTNRYVLGMKVGFEGRSPSADDGIEIGLIDLKKPNSWRKLGESRAWGWQQGCMLQWIPGRAASGSKSEIIFNDREGDHYVSRVVDVFSGKTRTLPKAVYALSPDGRWAVGTEFSRIQDLRPGYGYAGFRDPFFDEKAPAPIGLYRLDLKTGESKLLMSLAEAAEIPHNGESVADNFHWFNHLLINTDGSRITFLHRWRKVREERQVMARTNFVTRMVTMNPDGSDRFIIDPSGFTSHFIWRDPTHICAYTRPAGMPQSFYILQDKTGEIEPIKTEKMPVNGHQTYVPGRQNEWLLNDNYAGSDKNRNQTPYLYHLPSDRRIDLGHFPAGENYVGEWRCDLHPRTSPDGNFVCIDSTHGGNGRQLYLLDLRPVWAELGR
ncbi:MAG: hypothetical protein H7Y12_05135 [Sphingobacteriaceae bacterium]|nr:hypothetical protein [Cytophagaceae bacterium]